MTDERTTILQDEGDRFALDVGGVAVYGNTTEPALRHDVAARFEHGTASDRPLVHMVCWEEEPCEVSVSGRVTLAGDPDAPFDLRMRHEFDGDHHQSHVVAPLDHSLHVDSDLATPIHHALQMRTPLQLRFCNPWHVASDYRVDIDLGNNRLVSVRLTGATVATPQPCEEEECPPVVRGPHGP